MKYRSNKFSKHLGILCCLLSFTVFSSSLASTTLTFDTTSSKTGLPGDYGSRGNENGISGQPGYQVSTDIDGVTVGTPNIEIEWDKSNTNWQSHPGSGSNAWATAGGVGQFQNAGAAVVTFRPDEGYALYFDALSFIGDTPSTDPAKTYNLTVKIYDAEDYSINGDSSTLLWSQSTGDWLVGSDDAAKKDFDFNGIWFDHSVTLVFEKTKNGGNNDMAIDDFTFGQMSNRLQIGAGNQLEVNSYDDAKFNWYKSIASNGTLYINITTAPIDSDGLVIKNLQGSASGLINTSGSSTDAIITLADDGVSFNETFSGSIIGNAQIIKAGNANYNLTIGGDIQSSKLTVKAGQLAVEGNIDIQGDTTVAGGATLFLMGNTSSVQNTISINAGGTFILDDASNLNASNIDVNGTMQMGALSSLNASSMTISGQLVTGNLSKITITDTLQIDNEVSITGGSSFSTRILSLNNTLSLNDSTQLYAETLSGNGSIIANNSYLKISQLSNPNIIILNNSEIHTTNTTTLNADIQGSGTFFIDSGSLGFGASGAIGSGITLYINDGASFIVDKNYDSKNVIAGINGNGSLVMNEGTLNITGAGTTFQTSFIQAGSTSGAINYQGTGTQTYSGAGANFVNIIQSGTGTSVLSGAPLITYNQVTAQQGSLEILNNLSTSSLTLGSGSHTIIGNMSNNEPVAIQTNSLTLQSGGSATILITSESVSAGVTPIKVSQAVQEPSGGMFTFNLNTTGSLATWLNESYQINVLESKALTSGAYNFNLDGIVDKLGFVISDINYSKGISLTITQGTENKLHSYANSSNTENAANLFWEARTYLTVDSYLDRILTSLIINGTPQETTRSLASLSGSSYTSILSSSKDDLYNQVRNIRNRMTQMGLPDGYQYDKLPYVNTWIQANGGWSRLDQAGDRSGYTIDSVGGTVGTDVNLTQRLTIGAAFTANYNKVKSRANDYLSSDNDVYYANLFGRYQYKNWSHSIIFTGAWNDIDMNRSTYITGMDTINSRASTNGTSFGAHYGTAYNINLNREGNLIFQPLLNTSIYRTRIDSFTETGSGDANLRVDGLNATHGRIGAGARFMGILGTNILGRQSYGEARILGIQDYGDNTNTAGISLISVPGSAITTTGAKIGRTGVQIGAGISLPLNHNGSIYTDIDAEFKARANSVTGTLGYRYNF